MNTAFTSIERSLKGKTAEALASILFERGGYRVARLGVEELFREVKALNPSQYANLALEPALRTLPDLMVADAEVSLAKQVEIKFRSKLDFATRRRLADLIDQQRASWPNTYVLVMVGHSPNGPTSSYFQNFVKLIPPTLPTSELREFMVDSVFWSKMADVRDTFSNLKKSGFALDALVPILKTLKESMENKDSSDIEHEI